MVGIVYWSPGSDTTGARSLIRIAILIFLSALPFNGIAAESGEHAGMIVNEGHAYGNLATDIPIASMTVKLGQPFSFTCRDKTFAAHYVAWYGDVPEGELLGLGDSRGMLEIAVNNGDANVHTGCAKDDRIVVQVR